MSKLGWLFLVLLLTGCGSIKNLLVTETKREVVLPPENLYDCPTDVVLPQGEYTQKDVALLLIRLYQNNRLCANSLEQIRKFLEDAQKTVQEID